MGTGQVDLRNLRKLSEGAYGPAVIEDVIEHHELGNIQIPSTSYSCFVRARENNGEPVVQSLTPVNLQRRKRFATDGYKRWYNVCGKTYVRCVRNRGQWTFSFQGRMSSVKSLHSRATKTKNDHISSLDPLTFTGLIYY